MRGWPFLLLFLLSSCSREELCVVDAGLDEVLSKNIPQDINLLKESADIASKAFLEKNQQTSNEAYNRMFYAPWMDDFSPIIDKLHLAAPSGHAENLHKWRPQERKKLEENAALSLAPSIKVKAIAIRTTMAYRAPTEKPFFRDIRKPGTSYPFNDNIASMIYLGTPLRILHVSFDRAWFLVGNYRFVAWVKANDVAFVDENFIKSYFSHKLSVAIEDGCPLLTENHQFLGMSHIGMLLPKATDGVLVPSFKKDGFAELRFCRTIAFVEKPYRFTEDHILALSKKLLGTKYGWGGFLENRDCAQTIRDFMAVFGANGSIYIHCDPQKFISLKGRDKANFLKENATPFLTVIGCKGHVMLYVGSFNGYPVLFHNLWAIRTGEDGRYVVGKTILSTTQFGKGIENSSTCIDDKAVFMYDVSKGVAPSNIGTQGSRPASSSPIDRMHHCKPSP
ncbi:MAG: SH3 domain-containing protein [Holosporales bacterium]|jgi:hypothetical protein|nr:SH3 domain-containing protein [Holosporales bacterium]